MRLLVIDDDAAFAGHLHTQLLPLFSDRDWTYVQTLAEGLDALREAHALGNPYGILLLDLLLPGDALNIVRLPTLYQDFPDLAIIALTVRPLPTTPALALGHNTVIVSKEDAPAVVRELVQAGLRNDPA